MTPLPQLDEATGDVAEALFEAFADQAWTRLRYAARWTPAGDVGADFDCRDQYSTGGIMRPA